MATCWLLTRGEYSDYSVLAAFTTKELAEQALVEVGDAIEEVVLDVLPKDAKTIQIQMDTQTGEVIREFESTAYMCHSIINGFVGRIVGRDVFDSRHIMNFEAKDLETAVKACNEKRAQFLAYQGTLGQWNKSLRS